LNNILLLFSCIALMTWWLLSCKRNVPPREDISPPLTTGTDTVADPDTIVVDSRLTFQEAIAGTKAPDEILDQLVLIDVVYRSTDLKVHQGQILTNKKIEEDIREIFTFMLENNFVVEKAIPVVAYDWNDSLSMADNNSYSFCYRNISYSKHAKGLAIDINPRLNPLRWKNENRPNQPVGAVRDTTVNGTLYPGHVVVEEFKRRGFRWGHTFSKYYDDHHFEKQ
jgi:hypothetical protein